MRVRASVVCLKESRCSHIRVWQFPMHQCKELLCRGNQAQSKRGDRFSGRAGVVTSSESPVSIQHYSLSKTNRVTRAFQCWKGFWGLGASDQWQWCYMTATNNYSRRERVLMPALVWICWVCLIYQEFGFSIKVSDFEFLYWIPSTHGRNKNHRSFKSCMTKALRRIKQHMVTIEEKNPSERFTGRWSQKVKYTSLPLCTTVLNN